MLGSLRQQQGFLAQCLMALALLSVGLHAALPKGYMLDHNAETGAISVVFCSGGLGPQQRLFNLETGEIVDSDESYPSASTQPGTCAFAAAHALMPEIAAQPVPTAPGLVLERVFRFETRQAIRSLRRRLPPGRGPPSAL